MEVDLEPLTVLVGPNGSGKSSLLRAVLHRTHRPEEVWRAGADTNVLIKVATADGRKIGQIRGSLTNHQPVIDGQLVALDLNCIRQGNQTDRSARLADDGWNLVNTFASLGRDQESAAARIFASLVPHFSDVDVKPVQGGNLGFFFRDRWNPAVEYRPEQVSDGTMLVLAYVTILHQQNAPDLLAIEEPERGLHPYLIRDLVALLRKLATGELGKKPTQVLLATHSAELLNVVEPHEVRFMQRSSTDGSVEIRKAPLDSPDWAKAFAAYDESLRGMWLSGGLGGVPGA